jgi:hypothetical protein
MATFAQITKRNKERMRLIAQEAYVETASKVIERSPVDEGLFRNNWFAGVGAPQIKTTEAKAKKAFGELGGARFTEMLKVSTSFDLGDTLYFTNSLPYARRLEYGWSSKMAPFGMIRISAAEWPRTVEKIARQIK